MEESLDQSIHGTQLDDRSYLRLIVQSRFGMRFRRYEGRRKLRYEFRGVASVARVFVSLRLASVLFVSGKQEITGV